MAKSSLVFGTHAVRALIEGDPAGVLEVWIQERREPPALRRALSLPGASGIAVHRVSRRTIDRMAGEGAHQGVAARYRPSPAAPVVTLDHLLDRDPRPNLLVVLDEVQDPRNLGACMRSAAGAGADAVIVTKHRGAPLTAAARKAASGAAERLPLVAVTNLARALERLDEAGLAVVGADASADGTLYETDLRAPLALVLGGERRGLRRLTREKCRQLVSIPLSGAVESLNVSVAAGICLFEAMRQRSTGGSSGSAVSQLPATVPGAGTASAGTGS